MKVCYVYSNFHLSHLTGQQGLVWELAKKASHNKDEVFIVSNSLDPQKQIKNNKTKINLYLIQGLADLKTYLVNTPEIFFFLQRIKPDIIHVHGALLTVYIWFIVRVLNIPIFCLLSETLDRFPLILKKSVKYCLIRTTRIFTTSNYLKNQLITLGVPSHKINIVRIGLSDNFIKDTIRYFPEDTDIFYYGDSNKARGFDIILKLAQKLPHFKFKVVIRFKEEDCQEELMYLKKLPNVVLIYYPYAEKLKQMIMKSKVIVLPYRWMLIRPPISLLEPMALGKCVITSPMEGNGEVVKDGHNGTIVDFEKLDEVISKISFLIDHEQIRKDLGRQAKATLKQMYSLEEYRKIFQYYKIYTH